MGAKSDIFESQRISLRMAIYLRSGTIGQRIMSHTPFFCASCIGPTNQLKGHPIRRGSPRTSERKPEWRAAYGKGGTGVQPVHLADARQILGSPRPCSLNALSALGGVWAPWRMSAYCRMAPTVPVESGCGLALERFDLGRYESRGTPLLPWYYCCYLRCCLASQRHWSHSM